MATTATERATTKDTAGTGRLGLSLVLIQQPQAAEHPGLEVAVPGGLKAVQGLLQIGPRVNEAAPLMVAEPEVPSGIRLAQLVSTGRQGLQRALEASKRPLGMATQPVHIATREQRVRPAVAVIERVEQGQGLLEVHDRLLVSRECGGLAAGLAGLPHRRFAYLGAGMT